MHGRHTLVCSPKANLLCQQPLATFESQGSFSAGYSVQGTVPAGIAAAQLPDGLYANVRFICMFLPLTISTSFFRMTSTKQAGGVLINYSNRFSINGLSGESALNIKQAVLALDGATNGPPAVGNDAPPGASSSTTTSSISASTTTSTALDATTTTSDVTTTHLTHSETSDTQPAEASDSSDEENSSSGLSKGAVAGIAVAITITIMGSFASIAFVMYKRRQKKQNEVEEIAPGSPFSQKSMSELSAEDLVSSKTVQTRTTELSSETMIYEAGPGERPPELDCMTTFRAELEGSTPSTPK